MHRLRCNQEAASDLTRVDKLWNEFAARYHYLGYKSLVGAQMRCAVHDRDGWPLAMLGFSTAAWERTPRDRFIGWTPQKRAKNLPLVVDNPRFLILPSITIPNLGSHIRAHVRRRLPEDWAERYNTTAVLIETFGETPRYTGTVYRASGWLHVGTIQGRGRYDRDKLYDKLRKHVWLRPLRKDWKRRRRISAHCGRSPPPPVRGITAWPNGYSLRHLRRCRDAQTDAGMLRRLNESAFGLMTVGFGRIRGRFDEFSLLHVYQNVMLHSERL